MFTLDEWYAIAERGTSGDMVFDILRDWKANDSRILADFRTCRDSVKFAEALWRKTNKQDELRFIDSGDMDEEAKAWHWSSVMVDMAQQLLPGLNAVVAGLEMK